MVNLGKNLGFKHQSDDALKMFQQVTKQKPSHAYAWYAQGVIYRGRDESQALSAFEKAVKYDAKNKQFLTALGAAYFRAKRMVDARKTFSALVRAHPNDPQAWVNLAKSRQLSKAPGVTEALRQALRLAPEHAEAQALFKRYAD